MFRQAARTNLRRPLVWKRNFSLGGGKLAIPKQYTLLINILSGAYVGTLIVCVSSLYFMYHDANLRQNIPFELSIQNQIIAVKGINKDDVLDSPRYAVKHYRRLLIELGKEVADLPEVEGFFVPIISSDILATKSDTFANFYIDIVARYAKALLAKGQLEASTYVLEKIVFDDYYFYQLGDPEKLSECCRLLSKVNEKSRIDILKRSLNMLQQNFNVIFANPSSYLILDQSQLTDEVYRCLDELAYNFVKKGDLNLGLNIYLSNLKLLKKIETKSQAQYPLFNKKSCEILINQIKSHVSEIMWVKNYKTNAISWSEEIVDSIFLDHNHDPKKTELLQNVLGNLIKMYTKQKDIVSRDRCILLKGQLKNFVMEDKSWYDGLIGKFSRIIYHEGPVGIILKPLRERFGRPEGFMEIEQIEEEDVE